MDIPFEISRVPVVQERQATWIRANLDLADEIGLAFRAVRRGRRQSQREYARARGWSPAHQGRLETRATDLRLGQVLVALESTPFGLVVAGEEREQWPEEGVSVSEVATWVRAAMSRLELTTRGAAVIAGTSQPTVSRLCNPERAHLVRLGLAVALIEGLGGSARLGLSTSAGLMVTDQRWWPTGAVLPRARGNGRRLAAHGWIRRGMPSWYRWGDRAHLGLAPVWTAESPCEPRWEREQHGNGIAPSPLTREVDAA